MQSNLATPHGAPEMRITQPGDELAAGGFRASPAPTRAQLRRRFRAHAELALFDISGLASEGVAIYTLTDPRDIREVKYVGQTRSPRRRLLQHLNHAQLWLPDEIPWWIKEPKLRPLYSWVRELYRDDYRLPVMVVTSWVPTLAQARVAERAQIYEYLARHQPLCNVEGEVLGGQSPLF
jgi:hypothetical protein